MSESERSSEEKTGSKSTSGLGDYLPLIFLLLAVGLLFLSILLYSTKSMGSSSLCDTLECRELSKNLRRVIDFSVGPCEDFSRYACGKWASVHVPPTEAQHTTALGRMLDRPREILEQFMASGKGDRDDDEEFQILKTLHRSCMQEYDSRKTNVGPLLVIVRSLGGWGLTATEMIHPRTWSLQTTMESIFDLTRKTILFDLSVRSNGRNKGHTIMIGLPKDTLLSTLPPITNTDPKPKDPKKLSPKQQLVDYSNFGKLLYGFMEPEVNISDPSLLVTTVFGMDMMFPFLNWQSYLKAALSRFGVTITDKTRVQVLHVAYLAKFRNYIENFHSNDTLKLTLANYLVLKTVTLYGNVVWPTISHLVLGEDFKQIHSMRHAECTKLVRNELSSVIRLLIYKKFPNARLLSSVNATREAMRKAIFERIDKLKWPSGEMKYRFYDKILDMQHHLDFPEFVESRFQISDYLKTLPSLSENNVLVNVFDLRKDYMLRSYEKLGLIMEEHDCLGENPVTMAKYQKNHNYMEYRGLIMRPPLFHPLYPSAVNFGSLGFMIGHELYYSLKSNGLFEIYWLGEELLLFYEKIACFEKQYSKYAMNGMKVNGTLTLMNNVADTGAILAAYDAYKNWTAEHPGSPSVLPDLHFSADQLFFVSAAQALCSTGFEPGWETSERAPDFARILGSFANSPAFAQAFNCRSSREEICDVW